MKKLLVVLLAATLLGAAGIVQADAILVQSNDGDKGLVDGGYWALSDTGFSQSGDALVQTMYLESVTFTRASGTSGTEGNLYLKVFTGSTGGLGTFVGVSSNTVDFKALAENADGTWTFDSLALDKDTVYSYVVGVTNDSSNPDAEIRMAVSDSSDPLSGGAALMSDATAWDGIYDPTVTVVASVPEPATMGLLVLGGVGVLFRRKR